MGNWAANMTTVMRGIPAFFEPNSAALRGSRANVGVESASYYSTEPLRHTLGELVDFDSLRKGPTRLTVGAVNACTGAMRYFDSRDEKLGVEHVMASGALPPAFPAVRIDGEPYWDGGIYSKDIQFASRADSHIARQKQIHRLRHVIRELTLQIPASKQSDPVVKELSSWGCGTTMHVAHLLAPRLEGEDHTKDIDFSPAGIKARREAGYVDTMKMVERAPWREPTDPIEGVVEHH